MIRALTVSLLFAVLAVPAYAQDSGQSSDPAPTAQDNPATRQTDQSEDDYRRSQRRRDTGDIFEDIGINPNSTGTGSQIFGREVKAIDRLDQESRRHLNRQRAQALAEAQPGEPIDAAYEQVSKATKTKAKRSLKVRLKPKPQLKPPLKRKRMRRLPLNLRPKLRRRLKLKLRLKLRPKLKLKPNKIKATLLQLLRRKLKLRPQLKRPRRPKQKLRLAPKLLPRLKPKRKRNQRQPPKPLHKPALK